MLAILISLFVAPKVEEPKNPVVEPGMVWECQDGWFYEITGWIALADGWYGYYATQMYAGLGQGPKCGLGPRFHQNCRPLRKD